MTAPMADAAWSTDVDVFVRRLAERLHRQGAPEPLAAAVALTVRGARGVTAAELADNLGVPLEHVQRIEQGHVPLADFPPSLVAAARATDGLDWRF